MSELALRALPRRESELLEGVIGSTCSRLEFCHMHLADTEYEKPSTLGLHEITFAVRIGVQEASRVSVTWTQDAFGNPNRLSVEESPTVMTSRSVSVQDVSRLAPWSQIIGEPCRAVRPYTYRSNYARVPSEQTWHDVLWGLEFAFPRLSFLIAAACHGEADRQPSANDELVVAYTPESIGRLVVLRECFEELWTSG